jgi:hypothetical protein
MIAPRLRKFAMLMRNAGSGFRQHALGGGNHVCCGNFTHAAMVVHGADGRWQVAGTMVLVCTVAARPVGAPSDS